MEKELSETNNVSKKETTTNSEYARSKSISSSTTTPIIIGGGSKWDFTNSPYGLPIWPPRNYSCSFCRREFKSAQALGGHMNVHRRDRARLRSSSSDHQQLLLSSSPPHRQPPPSWNTAASSSSLSSTPSWLVSNLNPNPSHVRSVQTTAPNPTTNTDPIFRNGAAEFVSTGPGVLPVLSAATTTTMAGRSVYRHQYSLVSFSLSCFSSCSSSAPSPSSSSCYYCDHRCKTSTHNGVIKPAALREEEEEVPDGGNVSKEKAADIELKLGVIRGASQDDLDLELRL